MDWTCIMGRRLRSHVRVSLTFIGILQLFNKIITLIFVIVFILLYASTNKESLP